MSEELSEDVVEQAEEIKPSGTFVVTERMKAVARGENPDAVVAESEPETEPDTEVDEPERATVAHSDEPTSWITAADRARAVSYGLDPEDLDAYESREQFGSALRAIDKAFSRREPAKPEAKVEKQPEAESEYVDQLYVNGKVNVEYLKKHKDEIEGSEFLIAQAEHTASVEAKLAEFEAKQTEREQQLQQQEYQRFEAEFHRAVDAFRPELFGKSTDASGQLINLKPEDAEKRFRLLDACARYTEHLHAVQAQAGLSPSTPPLSEILKQAEFIAFPKEAADRARQEAIAEREKDLKRVAKQAQRVRPVATTAGADAAYRGAPPEDTGSTEAIMRHPKVKAWFDRVAANGSV
jgi:hypothetical protein